MTDTDKELLPCPFCGGEAEMVHVPGSWGYYSGKYAVYCYACGIATKAFDDERWEQVKGHINISTQAKHDAAEAWNRRAAMTDEAKDAARPKRDEIGRHNRILQRLAWLERGGIDAVNIKAFAKDVRAMLEKESA